jgi:hypothetical protein
MIFKRIKILLCDLGIVYVILYCFEYINPFFFPFSCLYFLGVIIYFLVSFFILQRSVFQYFSGIEIEKNKFIYTLFKILFLGCIPCFLAYKLDFIVAMLLTILFLLILNNISLLARRMSIWELCAKSKVKLNVQKIINGKIINGFIVGICIILFITTFQYVQTLREEKHTATVKNRYWIPVYHSAFPTSYFKVQKYVNDIERNKMSPKEYILNLFDNYDIVVLCERGHPEYTQYQMISEIVCNDTFANKVGNIATEFGRSSSQPLLDSLLNTTFSSEENRKKAFAALIRENFGADIINAKTNVYDFFTSLYQFNKNRDKNQRIKWFFSDAYLNWDEISTYSDWSLKYNMRYTRDLTMAINTISNYEKIKLNDKQNKLLVIQNYRHAFPRNVASEKSVADFLYEKYQSKVAFVWIHNFSYNFLLFFSEMMTLPSYSGLLDATNLKMKDSVWGISFDKSILGQQRFDLFPRLSRQKLQMKDVFNGMIYYLPPSKHYWKFGYEYMLDDYIETALKRDAITGKSQMIESVISYYKENKQMIEPYYFIEPHYLYLRFNLIYYFIHYFILLHLLFSLIVIKKRSKKEFKLNQSKNQEKSIDV